MIDTVLLKIKQALKNTTLYKRLHDIYYELRVKRTAEKLYQARFGRNIRWQNPTEFNEKLRWMQFYTDTSKWSLLSDKYRVREHLEQMGYSHLLVKLYGVWDKASEIDFDKLPNSFVIKTNHGSGSVFIVKDKSIVDFDDIRQQLDKDLNTKFGLYTAEPHYFCIEPKIIAEELLTQGSEVSTSIIDYKFYCVNGDPQFCGVMYNRNIQKHYYEVRLYDNEWNDISNLLSEQTCVGLQPVPKPSKFDDMRDFCNKVCKDFPFVRMDFYECNGKLYFGEFTFTPAACTGGALGPQACELLSKKIKL